MSQPLEPEQPRGVTPGLVIVGMSAVDLLSKHQVNELLIMAENKKHSQSNLEEKHL